MSERLVFDLSGIDWDDEESIRAVSGRIWELSATRMGGPVPEIEQPRRPEVILTGRFTAAVGYATGLHAQQARKGTTIPYASHLLGVAALVLEAGGDEDLAIAGLLHDAAEDHGGEARLVEIEQRFGMRIATIVRGCSDSLSTDPDDKAPWLERKRAHLLKLQSASPEVILVSAADKLHNVRATLTDVHNEGMESLDRFNGGRTGTVAYYSAVLEVLSVREGPATLVKPLELSVRELQDAVPTWRSFPALLNVKTP
jgi:(p)ppGpp synthase/HD superfamily hydrolase